MLTAATIRAHIEMMRSFGQHEYAESARAFYWDLLGEYLVEIVNLPEVA